MSKRQAYERYVWFHRLVKADKYPNSRHLIEEFEIKDRTAYRDIEFMRVRFQAPLAYDRIRRGYHYTDTSFELPSYWINESNVLALALAVRLASTVPDPVIKDDLCRLINNLTNVTGGNRHSCLQKVTEKVSVKNIEYARVDTNVFQHAVEALFADRTLQIIYFSPQAAKTTSRIIRPLHLMHYMGSWHLLAWCATRNSIRDFSLSRIRSIGTSDVQVDLPADLPSIKEYTRKHFGIMQGDETTEVVLQFSPAIASRISEQVWHPEQKTATGPDGGIFLSFPAADFREVAKVILSFGAEVDVVSPVILQEMIKKEIFKMMKKYSYPDTP